MIETAVRSRKTPLREIKMEDIKIEFVDMCVMPSEGMDIVEIDSSDSDSPMTPGMEILVPSSPAAGTDSVRPRKRAKLDHLSPEEKAQHRKMMNRISAQSARDRQKALMNQQQTTIKSMQDKIDALKKQNVVLESKNGKLATENTTLTEENQRLSNLVMELEMRLKAVSTTQTTANNMSNVEQTSTPDIKLEEQKEVKSCSGSLMEPAVLRTIPLPKGPDPLQNLSVILLLWTLYLGLWTQQNSCKSSESSLKKFSVENSSCLNLSSLTQLQKLLLHKWQLRPRPLDMELTTTPG